MVSSFLKRINSTREAPPNSYLIYDILGGIYYIDVKDFPNFTIEWIGVTKPPSFTMDLTSTRTHSLLLDFDTSKTELNPEIFQYIETILKMTFLPTLSSFTYILAVRNNHAGIHVHLPEFQVGHDDYILFCEALQQKFRQAMIGNDEYTLDILRNAMLPCASKPNTTVYMPLYLVYVDETNTYYLKIPNFHEEYQNLKKKFAKRRNNENSLFRSLLNINNLRMLVGELKHLMMPVVDARTDAPVYTLLYDSKVGHEPNRASNWRDVATFAYKKTKEQGYISKSEKFRFSPDALAMKVYYHLKLNACNMVDFQTNNHALKTWFERFGRVSAVDDAHIPPFFRDLHETLQFEHMNLAEDPNPIKTIMQYKEGYYFLPVFYALCQHYLVPSSEMAAKLRDLLDAEYHPLLQRIGALNPKNVQLAISEISLNTLHFCANNLHPEQPETNRDKLKWIVENNRRAILSVTTSDQMAELLRSMQERHLPIYVLKLKNALKKPSRFVWNALTDSWQEVTNDREITDHMNNLWLYVKQFIIKHKQSGGLGGPDFEIMIKFQIALLVSTIMSDTAMERKDIQMDIHKWFLRLEDGVLDLLTGHIGGVVPELFLSDRKITLGIPRLPMMRLCSDTPELEGVYERLLDKSFFQKYLQALFLDREPTLVDALQSLVPPQESRPLDDLARSMLHFYVNLCKCTSFEHELMLYMLDVLASVLVGTNYERKFFVWKGLTRNGKSKLFELMGRVLGGYYHSIQSENLTPGHSVNTATPELASTLFACRMVTSEELEKRLDENRVKQITGNSFVTFRNMYEQNSGGIPTAKVFATTNNYPECKASEAFKDRVVAIPFDAEFSDTAPATTSEQVAANTFPKEAYVVEQSFRGCFLMLYYHLKRRMTAEDGLLHYRQEPECVVEFTEDYLIHADIYVQFKLHMDVQMKPGSQTTLNEVRSAVRQYLKISKNTSFHESDLFLSFEREFGHLRQTDIKISSNAYSYISVVEEAAAAPKKMKLETDSSLIYYDGVVIKNLRRQNLDD